MKLDYQPRLQYIAPLVAAGIIGAGSQIAGSAINAASSGALNRRAERYNWEMWNVQRQAQIQDWWRTQAYNSPENQMKLYKAAGLNPNLVYGDGNFKEASTGAPPSGQALNLKQPDVSGAANAVGTYFNVRMQQQMLQNQAAENDRIIAQADLARAQAEATRTGIPKIQEEITGLKIANYVNDAIKNARIAIENGNILKQTVEVNAAYQEMINHIAQTSSNVQEAVTRMLKNLAETSKIPTEIEAAKAMINSTNVQTQLHQMELEYEKKYGAKMPQTNNLIAIMQQISDYIIKRPKGDPTKVSPGEGYIQRSDGTWYQPEGFKLDSSFYNKSKKNR